MESSGSKVNIVVFDACRNNPFRSFRSASGGLAGVVAPRGTYVAYATAPGRVAVDGEGKNSPYTAALAEAMRTPGAKLEDVFKRTREIVLASTRNEQVPWESSSITGDFFFKDGPVDVKQAEPAPDKIDDSEARAKAAFDVAGDDLNMLRTVAAEFAGTSWSKLAAAKAKSVKEKMALLVKPVLKGEPSQECDQSLIAYVKEAAQSICGETRDCRQVIWKDLAPNCIAE